MNCNRDRAGWVEGLGRNPKAHFRLFCFPPVGGTSVTFRAWANGSCGEAEVCPIQLPGRDKRIREEPLDRMQTIVQTLVEVLPLNRPFALFGHSMGALMAFELARELRRQRRPAPACLFLSAHHAPQIPARRNKSRHLLPEAELIAELRCLNGTPEGVLQDGSLMQMLMPMLRADFAVVETYTYMPEPPLNCPITVFGGEQDPETTQEELASWREQTSASFSLRMFPGGHFFLHQAQPQLLREMSETTCMTLRHAAAGPAIW